MTVIVTGREKFIRSCDIWLSGGRSISDIGDIGLSEGCNIFTTKE
jgi:hypothetical protein